MIGLWTRGWAISLLLCTASAVAQGNRTGSGHPAQQDSNPTSGKPTELPRASYALEPGEDPENRLISPFLKHLAADQKEFWTTPLRMNRSDAKIVMPFAAFTGALIASDSWLSRQLPSAPSSLLTRSNTASNYALYSLMGVAGGSYLMGHIRHDDRLSEAGFLSGEAALNSTAVTYLLKTAMQRPRPLEANGNGTFFDGGGSFPSEHASIAWSIASVWAHEYPGWFSQTAAYGLASAVTLSRVTARKHFPSDVLIGSALGWYFGRQVYRAHHDPALGGTAWGDLVESDAGEHSRNPANMGSPYVPMDSWVYPIFDRLIALGYLQSSMAGLRPWTRLQCAGLLQEAQTEFHGEDSGGPPVQGMVDALVSHFEPEMKALDGARNISVSVDSVYSRVTGISGKPLRDGFHLAQTIVNDYGRPYAEGTGNVTGVSAHANAGPLYISFQGEYQMAPAAAGYPAGTLQQLAQIDQTPVLSNGLAAVSRFRVLEASLGFTYQNLQFSFGKQNLWLGPGRSGPFLFSTNAEAIPMLRVDQIEPVYVPGISRILGPMRSEFILGRLAGNNWVFAGGQLYGPSLSDQPFVHVDKLSFQPTRYFEFGMGFSVLFGGPGQPVTWRSFLNTYTSSGLASNGLPGTAADPGDRRSTAEFTYRLPHLRDWATFYGDAFVEDEISPLGSSRPAVRLGLYLPKLPKLRRVELRAESVYTDAPNTLFIGNYYDNGRFRSGYTNYEQILGSWIGRAGKGGQAWMKYWFSPRSSVEFQYRRQVVSNKFLPGGGGLNDFGLKTEVHFRPDLSLQGLLQYETWKFPVLDASAKSNIVSSLQLTFYPKCLRNN